MRISQRHIASRQSGFTLLELILVLAMIGILIAVVILPNIHKGEVEGQVMQDSDAIASSTSSIREAYATSSDFSGVTTAMIVKYFPASMVSGSTIKTAGGSGTITLLPTTTLVANDTLQWTVTGYSNTACDKLASRFGNSASTIRINGGTGYVQVKSPTSKYNAGAAVSACVNATSNSLQIEFTR